jgi:hypothetical protein
VGIYVNKIDLENAITPRTVLQCYDDLRNGNCNEDALNLNIDRAEAMAESYLEPENVVPLATPTLQPGSVQPVGAQKPVDRLVKNAVLLYLIAYTYERHSEYAKTYGTTIAKNISTANEMMLRIQQGTQRLPDTNVNAPPKNVGGFTYSDADNMFIGSTNDVPNMGDL